MLEQEKIIAGRYQISDFIGRGGMAKIYKAVDLRLDRMVKQSRFLMKNTLMILIL